MSRLTTLQQRTIQDFGDQWKAYPENVGFYASRDYFAGIFSPLLDMASIRGSRVGEIGAGTGRLVRILLELGAAHVVALEPSTAFEILKRACEREPAVTCLRATGEQFPASGDLDLVFAIGVLHHIPAPEPVVKAAFESLRPGGRFAIWVYGREGNTAYLAAARLLRTFTTRIPHRLLVAFCWLLWVPAYCYLHTCRALPLPLGGYMTGVWSRLSARHKHLAIYDQLNPAYARYYAQNEVRALLKRGGFRDIRLHHRHGYSWAAVATKPAAPEVGATEVHRDPLKAYATKKGAHARAAVAGAPAEGNGHGILQRPLDRTRRAVQVNALCVDVDDLSGALAEQGLRIRPGTYLAEAETEALLAELQELGLTATFFVPGLVLREAPRLPSHIADAGHEVAAHGTIHRRVGSYDRKAFLADVRANRLSLEDLIGRPVDTYKAPVWSITPTCIWAYDALIEAGYKIDHSALPRLKRALGVPPDQLEPFLYAGALTVIPVTTVRILGVTFPYPGGFRNAYVPLAVQCRIFERINRRGLPFNFYFHPFEHSPAGPNRALLKYRSVRATLYAAHAGRYRPVLRHLAGRFRFGPLKHAYGEWIGGDR